MKCPSCGNNMQAREGKFGEFYFCPKQHICKQKTITTKQSSIPKPNNGLMTLSCSAEQNWAKQSLLEIHYQACIDHIDWLYD